MVQNSYCENQWKDLGMLSLEKRYKNYFQKINLGPKIKLYAKLKPALTRILFSMSY